MSETTATANANGEQKGKPQRQDKPQGEKGGKREGGNNREGGNREGGNREGGNREGGNREGGNNRPRGDRHEESKGEKEPFKYKPRHKGLAGEKIVVDLNTVIPDLPKKGELLPEPSDEAFQAELDKNQKEIDDCYKKMSDLNKDVRNKNYLPADKTYEDLVSLLKVKQEERRRAYDEFQATMTERDVYKKQVDEYHDRANEYRFKMKVPGKRSDLEVQLRDLKNTQSKGSITLQEEKKLIKEISEIERSLPFAGPLEELEDQAKDVNAQLKIAKQKTSQKFDAHKIIREECQDVQDKLDKMREEHDKKKEETTPAIIKMKEEYRSRIEALKQKKRDDYNNHKESWRKYQDQQTEIERIKLMRRKKDKLVRDEQRRVRDEEWKKQKQQEEEDNKEIPYRAQIELCELLIKYANKLAPASDDASTTISQKDKETVIEEALKSEEWKQAKGQMIKSRKEREDDFFTGGKKAKKVQTKQVQEPTQPQNLPLNHQIETLNFFEEIKVAPPLFVDRLPETLKVLQEKKAYFEKLSADAIQADEARSNMNDEDKKKYDEEVKQKRAEEQTSKKEEKRHAAKKRFDPESEQDFPKM